jgi:hypothetical protein
MSEQTDELLTGREGVEASQGFREMPSATPDVSLDDGPLRDELVRHIERPNQPEPVERVYQDADGSGRRRDEHETVPAERAARDLSEIRAAERAERERAENEELNQALDYLKTQVEAPAERSPSDINDAARAQAAQQQPEVEQPQAELDPEQAQQQIAEADREIEKFLANPAVRSRVEYEFGQVQQQAAARVEQAKQTYEAGLAQNALVGLAVMHATFPELQGMNPEQINGALRMMRPERVEQYRQHVGQITTLTEAYRRQVGELQQQQQQQQQQIAQQQQQALAQYAQAEVKRYEAATAHENPETMKALRENSFPMIERHYGVPEATMRALASGQQKVDSTALLHSSAFQLMITDALKYSVASRNQECRGPSGPASSAPRNQ